MMLLAYAAGVNAFLASCSARPVELQALGHEPDTWQAWDAIAVFVARHVIFATFHHKLFRARLAAGLGAQALQWFRQEGAAGSDVPWPAGTSLDLDGTIRVRPRPPELHR